MAAAGEGGGGEKADDLKNPPVSPEFATIKADLIEKAKLRGPSHPVNNIALIEP